jgi:pyruvate/2-oxoglutarate dehydrogenase complex dihydrolipoamide dehydrogenase (E3) component
MRRRCGSLETPVFLAGDVSGLRGLLHEASDEGHIAGENAARLPDGVEAKPRRCPLSVVFTEPQLVVVGDGSVLARPRRTRMARWIGDGRGGRGCSGRTWG